MAAQIYWINFRTDLIIKKSSVKRNLIWHINCIERHLIMLFGRSIPIPICQHLWKQMLTIIVIQFLPFDAIRCLPVMMPHEFPQLPFDIRPFTARDSFGGIFNVNAHMNPNYTMSFHLLMKIARNVHRKWESAMNVSCECDHFFTENSWWILHFKQIINLPVRFMTNLP